MEDDSASSIASYFAGQVIITRNFQAIGSSIYMHTNKYENIV